MESILIVEDEAKLAELLTAYLAREGYAVTHLDDGAKVIDWIRQAPPSAILLDVMLPHVDGLTLCRDIRHFSQVPILMTTARVDEIDRLLGLELGADDYICKPYSPREVVARVKAVLRRQQAQQEPASHSIRFEDDKLRVTFQGNSLELTLVEYQLLRLLAQEPGRIFSRDHLMDRIYPDRRIVADRTIDSHVKKLRRKLAAIEGEQPWIQSVYGAGYRFEL